MKKTKKAKGKPKSASKPKPQISPLADRVLIRPFNEQEAERTASGIFIPASAHKETKFKKGEVTAVGNGWYQDGDLIPLRVKVGDTVLFPEYAGDEVEVEGKKYMILKEDSIIAIINK